MVAVLEPARDGKEQPTQRGTKEIEHATGNRTNEEVDDVLHDEVRLTRWCNRRLKSGGGSRISLSASCSKKSFIVVK